MCYFCVVIMFICGHNDATVHLRCYFYVRLMLIMCYSLLWIMCCSLVSVKFSSSIPCFLSSPAEHSFWIHGFDPGQEWLLTWFEWHTWNHSILARIKTRSGTKLGCRTRPKAAAPTPEQQRSRMPSCLAFHSLRALCTFSYLVFKIKEDASFCVTLYQAQCKK